MIAKDGIGARTSGGRSEGKVGNKYSPDHYRGVPPVSYPNNISRRYGSRRGNKSSDDSSEDSQCADFIPESVTSINNGRKNTLYRNVGNKVDDLIKHLQEIKIRKNYLLSGLGCFMIVVGLIYWKFSHRDLSSSVDEINMEIEKEFPGQDKELWSTIFSTMKANFQKDPTRPVVLLLLFDQEENEADRTSSCLVSEIARKASKIMRRAEPDPIIVDGSGLQPNNFNVQYKLLVEKNGTLVLKHLENIPCKVAEDLHYFCDVENPMVPKSMYLFTLSVKNFEGKPTNTAEQSLKKLWAGKINPDSLEALITRLTDQVAYIKAEKDLPSNC